MTNKQVYDDLLKTIQDRITKCGDCKYSKAPEGNERKYLLEGTVFCTHAEVRNGNEMIMWADDFCSYGERRGKK